MQLETQAINSMNWAQTNVIATSGAFFFQAYGMLSEEDKLTTFINEMIATNFTSIDKREIEQYLKGLFMSLKLD